MNYASKSTVQFHMLICKRYTAMEQDRKMLKNPEIEEKILTEVCNHFEVTTEELRSKRRLLNLVLARSFYAKLCMELVPRITKVNIGKRLQKDHSTIIHSLQQFESRLFQYKHLNDVYTRMKSAILGLPLPKEKIKTPKVMDIIGSITPPKIRKQYEEEEVRRTKTNSTDTQLHSPDKYSYNGEQKRENISVC